MTASHGIFTGCPACGAGPLQQCRDESRIAMADLHRSRHESAETL